MPDTEVAEKVGAEATTETPTDSLVAQPGDADAPAAVAGVTEPTTAAAKVSAPPKPSREEQLERELRVSRGDQAKMRLELNALRASTEVELARTKAIALGTDPDEAARAVQTKHKDDDRAQAETDGKALRDNASAEMGQALIEAGLTVADWNDPENERLFDLRGRWLVFLAHNDTAALSKVARMVKAMKPAPAKAAEPPKRSAAQRSRDNDDDGGPAGGGAGGVKTKAQLMKIKSVGDVSDADYFRIIKG